MDWEQKQDQKNLRRNNYQNKKQFDKKSRYDEEEDLHLYHKFKPKRKTND